MTNLYNIYTKNSAGQVVKTNRLARMATYQRRAIYTVRDDNKEIGQSVFWSGNEGVALCKVVL